VDGKYDYEYQCSSKMISETLSLWYVGGDEGKWKVDRSAGMDRSATTNAGNHNMSTLCLIFCQHSSFILLTQS
jgi:hypothetical protein